MEPYDVAMVKEGTPGKYQLRAVLPGSRRPLIESYASLDGVAARRAALEQAGYNVLVTFMEGELLQLEGHRGAPAALTVFGTLRPTYSPDGSAALHLTAGRGAAFDRFRTRLTPPRPTGPILPGVHGHTCQPAWQWRAERR